MVGPTFSQWRRLATFRLHSLSFVPNTNNVHEKRSGPTAIFFSKIDQYDFLSNFRIEIFF